MGKRHSLSLTPSKLLRLAILKNQYHFLRMCQGHARQSSGHLTRISSANPHRTPGGGTFIHCAVEDRLHSCLSTMQNSPNYKLRQAGIWVPGLARVGNERVLLQERSGVWGQRKGRNRTGREGQEEGQHREWRLKQTPEQSVCWDCLHTASRNPRQAQEHGVGGCQLDFGGSAICPLSHQLLPAPAIMVLPEPGPGQTHLPVRERS